MPGMDSGLKLKLYLPASAGAPIIVKGLYVPLPRLITVPSKNKDSDKAGWIVQY